MRRSSVVSPLSSREQAGLSMAMASRTRRSSAMMGAPSMLRSSSERTSSPPRPDVVTSAAPTTTGRGGGATRPPTKGVAKKVRKKKGRARKMSAKTLRRRGGRKKNRRESLTAEIVEKVQNLTDSADVGGFASNFTKELARKTRRCPVDTRHLAERVESASREKRSGPIDIGGFSSNFTRALTRQAKSMSGAGQVEQERRASITTMRRRRGSISLGRTVPLGSRVDSVAHLTKRPESVAERELASRQLWNAAHDRNVKRAEQLIVVGGFDMDWVSPAKGTTALWELCRGALFECARLLLRVGDIKRWHGHARFHEEELLDDQEDPSEAKIFESRSCLYWACFHDNAAFAKILLKPGRDTHVGLCINPRVGTTPLWWACFNKMEEVAMHLLTSETCVGIDPDCKNIRSGTTPFWWACYRGMETVCNHLLSLAYDAYGIIDVSVVHRVYGSNPAWWARKSNLFNVADKIERYEVVLDQRIAEEREREIDRALNALSEMDAPNMDKSILASQVAKP